MIRMKNAMILTGKDLKATREVAATSEVTGNGDVVEATTVVAAASRTKPPGIDAIAPVHALVPQFTGDQHGTVLVVVIVTTVEIITVSRHLFILQGHLHVAPTVSATKALIATTV